MRLLPISGAFSAAGSKTNSHIATMHKRAEYNGILTSLESLTPGKQQRWLDAQPSPTTKQETATQKRVKRLIRLAKDEEKE